MAAACLPILIASRGIDLRITQVEYHKRFQHLKLNVACGSMPYEN